MIAVREFVRQSDRALLWLASLIVLGAGFYVAFAFVDAAIDAQDRLTARAGDVMRANAGLLAQRPRIALQASALATSLRSLHYHADRPTSVARFIAIVTRIAARRAVSIMQIDGRDSAPSRADPLGMAGQGTAGRVALESLPLDVTLGGSYRALLATIRDLAQAPLVMNIDVAALERTAGAADANADGMLIARLHVVLERVADSAPAAPAQPVSPEEASLNARLF